MRVTVFRVCAQPSDETQALRLASFGKAGLPFPAVLACVEHVVGLADLNDLCRQHAVAARLSESFPSFDAPRQA